MDLRLIKTVLYQLSYVPIKYQQNLQTERSNFGIREDLGYYNITVLFSPIEVKIDNVLLAG